MDTRIDIKEEINEAIRNLQKTIRKGAISNEYLHAEKRDQNKYLHGALNAIREQTETL